MSTSITKLLPAATAAKLGAHYDLSDSTDTTKVTVTGGEYVTLKDLSGNGRDLDGTGHAPDVDASAQNGLDVADLNGSSEYWSRASWLFDLGAADMFVVCNVGVSNHYRSIISESYNAGNFPHYQALFTGTSFQSQAHARLSDNSNSVTLNGGIGGTTPFDGTWNLVMQRDTGSAMSNWTDGAEGTVNNYARSGTYTNLNRFAIGAEVRSSVTSYLAGKIGEVLIFTEVLSESDRQIVEGYLAQKWGLLANLASDHPYKAGLVPPDLRAITLPAYQHTVASSYSYALLAEMEFASGTVRAWTGYGDFVWGSLTFNGTGNLGRVDPIEETVETRAVGLRYQLSGIDSSLITLALDDPYQNRPARLWLAILDDDGQLVADPIKLSEGKMDVMSIDDDGSTATITLSTESQLIDLRKPRLLLNTHADQQALYPGDDGFEFVEAIADRPIIWGRPSEVTSGSGGTGGNSGPSGGSLRRDEHP